MRYGQGSIIRFGVWNTVVVSFSGELSFEQLGLLNAPL
jgi:hypothetical protein